MTRFTHRFIPIGVIFLIFITFTSFNSDSYESSLKETEYKLYGEHEQLNDNINYSVNLQVNKNTELYQNLGIYKEALEDYQSVAMYYIRQNRLLLLLLLCFLCIIIVSIVFLRIRNEKSKIDILHSKLQSEIIGYQDKLKRIKGWETEELNHKKYISQFHYGIKLKDTFPKLYSLVSITFPTLSYTERDYVILFTINLPEEQICKYQNIQKSSIRKIKQRLREKVGINKDDDLTKYFQKKLKM